MQRDIHMTTSYCNAMHAIQALQQNTDYAFYYYAGTELHSLKFAKLLNISFLTFLRLSFT